MADRESLLKDARDIAKLRLKNRQPRHVDVVRIARAELEGILPDFTDRELRKVVSEIECTMTITTAEPDVLAAAPDAPGWFHQREDSTKTPFFDRYIEYLRRENFPESVLEQMRKTTRRILSLSANPFAPGEKKKGLVVGDVQSGKTANYLALINLACDYGYRIVVLLAGMTDSLREQTQGRIDIGFIGAESATIAGNVVHVGVGESGDVIFAVPLTNTEMDFVKPIHGNLNATPSEFKKPLILVVKKNGSVLKRVREWLKPDLIRAQSVLIIDDESDNASVNARKDENNPTVINKRIRELFDKFPTGTYVGFTATPFANIFINPTDDVELRNLFPSDFIVQLREPSNYCGPHWFFDGSSDNPRLRLLDEKEPGFLPAIHKKDATFHGLTESMEEAVLCFLLGCAVRTLRGDGNKHRSMLVNISRFNSLQWDIGDAFKDFVGNVCRVLSQETYKPLSEYLNVPLLRRIHDLYESGECFGKARTEFSFEEIKTTLKDESKLVEVVILNNTIQGNDRFSYANRPEGARVIVVGGFLLSRGLTLEGLMISYYSRNTSTYDALLQMGRWFGYRFGYEDLCRLYISPINRDNFRAVIEAVDDLKDQFREMAVRGVSPREYGLMVRQCPDSLETALLVTSRNKMLHSQTIVYWIAYGGTVTDTSKISKDSLQNDRNDERCRMFLDNQADHGRSFEIVGNRRVLSGVPKREISHFVRNLEIHPENRKFDTETLADYIEQSELFPEWDVTIASGSSRSVQWAIGGFEVPAAVRDCENRKEEDFLRVGRGNNRLIEPGIFAAGLSQTQLADLRASKKGDLTYADYLGVKDRRPLLVFYPLELVFNGQTLSYRPIVGFAVGFPTRGRSEKVKYRANEVKLKERLSLDIMDETEENK